MRIVHFSDWHGNKYDLPHADLYVCTGDMLKNYPDFDDEDLIFRIIPSRESTNQRNHVRKHAGSYRNLFANRDAPVVCVRGNHDFTDLADLFGGDVWEVTDDPARTTTVQGVKVGGCRGIPFIIGCWSDELMEDGRSCKPPVVRAPVGDFRDVVAKVPDDLEILVTHAPPHGILDEFGQEHIGSTAIRSHINQQLFRSDKQLSLKAHLFGHIHEACMVKSEVGIVFSNAATSFQIVDI